jgi:NAD(P)-dependent dehydrogenase (short-subunit alcohol dehydrogenase family)
MPVKHEKAALIVGAGDATGGAIAKRFAREGYATVMIRRHADALEELASAIRAEGGTPYPMGVDARDEDQIVALFAHIEEEIGPLEAVIFNIGANVHFSIIETTARVFRKVWEMACFAGFLTGREAARHMLPRGRGTVIFTGATASVRGGPGFSAFASAKHGLRALAQSMARELGPKGIHVAHSVIDGAIDTAWIAENFPERYKLKEEDGILDPAAIADAYWALHCQPRSAWTHELDLRPWMEKF